MAKSSRVTGGTKRFFGAEATRAEIGGAPSAIVPQWFFLPLLFITLAVPNLVFSGPSWFDTLHLMKWAVTMLPVALIAAVGGARLLFLGPGRLDFRLDLFGWLWFAGLLYFTVQPMWADIMSLPTLVKEWFFVACMLAVYLFTLNMPKEMWHRNLRWFLLAISVNAAINVVFAEIQYRGLVKPEYFFIMYTPYNYIGNTGQQNMLAFSCLLGLLGMCWTYFTGAFRKGEGSRSWISWFSLLLLGINAWGLWSTTSRSAAFSFLVGLFFLAAGLLAQGFEKRKLLGRAFSILLVFVLALAIAMGGVRGSGVFYNKFVKDMMEHPEQIGGRTGIWATSWTMFTMHPITGVGLGHFKWNYLDAQRKMFDAFPDQEFQYTHWAHNELLQWYAEGGLPIGLLFTGMMLWWFYAFVRTLLQRRAIDLTAVWANAFLCAWWFDAFWTRPFHRIEHAVWFAFAYALANRELLAETGGRLRAFLERPLLNRLLGCVTLLAALGGIAFLTDGMIGDRKLLSAMTAEDGNSFLARAREAAAHLMVRVDAERQVALFYIRAGEANRNADILLEGLNKLTRVFEQEPQAEDLQMFLHWAPRLGRRDILEHYASYMKPGTYEILSAPAASSQ